MSDALSLLREFITAGKEVTRSSDGKSLLFDGRPVPIDFPTNFKAQRGAGKPYTIGSVWFLLPLIDEKAGPYMKACKQAGIPSVSQVDKRVLAQYVKGEVDTAPHLDQLNVVPLPAFDSAAATADVTMSEAEEASRKRPRDDETGDAAAADAAPAKKPATESAVAPSTTALPGLSAPAPVADTAKKPAKIREPEPVPVLPTEAQGAVDADAAATKDILSRERKMVTRRTAMQANGKVLGPDIFAIVNSARRSSAHLANGRAGGAGGSSRDRRSSAQSSANRHGGSRRSEGGTPIIIVPSGMTSIVNMMNIQDLLEHHKYVDWQEKKKNGGQKERTLLIKHHKGVDKHGKDINVQYAVTDNVSKFKESDWERVIAVFVTGKKWQFKDWPWKEPVEIFNQVRGYHLILDDERQGHLTKSTLSGANLISNNVRSWNVKVMTVSRFKRHKDQQLVQALWQDLQGFVARNKPFLKH